VAPNDGGVWGGHAVCLTGYDDSGSVPVIQLVSWGKHMAMTLPFWNKYVSEAYALMLEDWEGSKSRGPDGLDLAAWNSDLTRITA
jgi:C1A family cysteine protease